MKTRNVITLLGVLVLGATMMSAQATRTWVSGVGDDANPCSRTAPCKTFAGAISKTAPGGEIDALDPGGFGALTITKSITIDGGGGQVASVLVAGTNGIVVAAGATDIVILRNLRFDGLRGAGNANAGLSGIRFISGGTLIVDKCEIFGFNTNGIDVALGASASVAVTATNIQNIGGIGVSITTTTGIVSAAMDRVRVESANKGIEAAANSRVAVESSFVENAGSIGMLSDGGNSVLTVNNSQVNFATSGIQTGSGSGSGSASVSNTSVPSARTGSTIREVLLILTGTIDFAIALPPHSEQFLRLGSSS
jgi:hypothetical protein